MKSTLPTSMDEIYLSIDEPLKDFEARYQSLLVPHNKGFTQNLVDHVSDYQGKRLRPALVMLAGNACGQIGPEHTALACSVEAMHVATLVHDDVLDEAKLRRQHPTTNAKWGNEPSVLLGDYLFSRAFVEVSRVGRPEVSIRFSEVTTLVCEGELLQIAERHNPELEQVHYEKIIALKTASLTAFASEVGAHLSGADKPVCDAMEAYGRYLGIAFQIADDCLDITGEESVVGKSLGTDLQKGKVTLPLIRLREIAPPEVREQLVQIVSAGAGHEERDRIDAWVHEYDCLAYANQHAALCVAQAKECLVVLPPSHSRDAMEALADFVIQRSL